MSCIACIIVQGCHTSLCGEDVSATTFSLYVLCRCLYRPAKPFADFLQKLIAGKVNAVKPTPADLKVLSKIYAYLHCMLVYLHACCPYTFHYGLPTAPTCCAMDQHISQLPTPTTAACTHASWAAYSSCMLYSGSTHVTAVNANNICLYTCIIGCLQVLHAARRNNIIHRCQHEQQVCDQTCYGLLCTALTSH